MSLVDKVKSVKDSVSSTLGSAKNWVYSTGKSLKDETVSAAGKVGLGLVLTGAAVGFSGCNQPMSEAYGHLILQETIKHEIRSQADARNNPNQGNFVNNPELENGINLSVYGHRDINKNGSVDNEDTFKLEDKLADLNLLENFFLILGSSDNNSQIDYTIINSSKKVISSGTVSPYEPITSPVVDSGTYEIFSRQGKKSLSETFYVIKDSR